MTRRDELNMDEILAARATQDTLRPDPNKVQGNERTRPAKLSVPLEAPTYRRLLAWLAKSSGESGTKIPTTKVGAALFAELLVDEALAGRVLARVQKMTE